MESKYLGAWLREVGAFTAWAGAPEVPRVLAPFAALLEGAPTLTIAALVRNVNRAWTLNRRVPAYPAALKAALVKLEASQRVLPGDKASKDLQILLQLFEGKPTQDLATFVQDVRAGLAPTPRAQPPQIDHVLVKEKAAKLAALSSRDPAGFEANLKELADETTTPMLLAITALFLGADSGLKTKKAAVAAMTKRHKQDHIQASGSRVLRNIGA